MLASTTRPIEQPLIAEIWPILVLLVVLVFVGFILIGYIRRWMRSDEAGLEVGFTLSDLRRLNREGKMSDKELKVAEQQMIRRVRAIASDSEVLKLRPKSDLHQNPNADESGREE
jgi:hypothetical protein